MLSNLEPQTSVSVAVARVRDDPVGFWINRLDVDSRPAYESHFDRWMRWLHKRPGWENATPRDLLIRQHESEDQYLIVDLLQEYVGSLVLRKTSKQKSYKVVRSFFLHNRCPLPADPAFRIRGDKPHVEGELTPDDILEAYHAATLRYRGIIMSKWQSFLDNARLIYANRHCSDQIIQQIQANTHPVRIDLPGRKSNENEPEGRYFTFIGKDAVDAIVKYIEEERGWPRHGEPIWIQTNRRPLHKPTMEATWLKLMRRTGKVPKRKGPIGSRYAYNLLKT